VDYIQKPSLSEMSTFSPVIREKIISASQAKIRIHQYKKAMNARNAAGKIWDNQSVVAIGASTGGTEALREVLAGLPVSIPPIIVVQHIPPVFSRAFADRLNDLCPFEVKEAESGDVIRPNRVLIAPGGRQMKVVKMAKGLCVELNDDSMVNRHKPSVDYLFNSVAEEIGNKAIGIILTGMGADGAQGLLKMKEHGAITLSQDEASSVVYGMPKEAWEIGASQLQVSLDDVPQKILDILGIKKVG